MALFKVANRSVPVANAVSDSPNSGHNQGNASPPRENGGLFHRNNSNGTTRGPGARYTPPPTAAAGTQGGRGGSSGVQGPAPCTHDSDDGADLAGQGRCLPMFWFLGGSGRKRSEGALRNGVKVHKGVTAVRTITVAERESPNHTVSASRIVDVFDEPFCLILSTHDRPATETARPLLCTSTSAPQSESTMSTCG